MLLLILPIAPNVAVGELRFQERVTVFSNRIKVCVSQQLRRVSISSFFQSALLRYWQPFSVMPLFSEYKHSYKGITITSAATVPSPVARIRYLRFCCRLIYLLITEAEGSEFSDVGSAEGGAPLFSDDVVTCIKQLLHSCKSMSSVVGCLLSLSSTSLRTAGRPAAEILLYSESFNGYTGRNYGRVRVHSFHSWSYLWRGCGPCSPLLPLAARSSLLSLYQLIYQIFKMLIFISKECSRTLCGHRLIITFQLFLIISS